MLGLGWGIQRSRCEKKSSPWAGWADFRRHSNMRPIQTGACWARRFWPIQTSTLAAAAGAVGPAPRGGHQSHSGAWCVVLPRRCIATSQAALRHRRIQPHRHTFRRCVKLQRCRTVHVECCILHAVATRMPPCSAYSVPSHACARRALCKHFSA